MSRHRFLTVGEVARHYASLPQTRDAQVLVADDDTYTWAHIYERACRLANGLAATGLEPGEKVATLLPNRGEYVEIMYGLALGGYVIVPLNSRYVGREVVYGVDFAEARALITTADYAGMIAEIEGDLGTIPVYYCDPAPAERFSYEELLASASAAPPDVEVSDDDLYWMPFTSGTTGDPKAAMVTHRALVEHWNIVTHTFEVTTGDVMLIAGPFYHSLGFLFGLTGLFAGGRIAIHSAFDPDRVLHAIEDLRVTMTPMVPTMYTMVLASPERSKVDVSSMRAVVSAGSPLLTGTKDGLLELFSSADLYEFYGSTEVGVATCLRPEDQQRKVRSVGQPVLGSEIALLDDDGSPVPPGEAGEICKRGALLGAEYHRNPEATEVMYRPGGWAATGDLGIYDEEGYLYIVDRKKDMIISGGTNVFPSEIEEVISKLDGVLEVAVVGIPDEKWGEAIKAVIVSEPGASLDEADVLAACEKDLAGYKKPRSVDFVDEMPKTGTGKILKRELRERFWASEDARVH